MFYFFLFFFNYCRAGSDSISSFFFLSISSFRRESLMILSVRSFVCITETRKSCNKRLKNSLSTLAWRAIHPYVRAFPDTELTTGYTCVCSVFRGSLCIIESRTREFSFGTLAIRVAGRRMSHLNRVPLISWLLTFSRSFKLYFARPKK